MQAFRQAVPVRVAPAQRVRSVTTASAEITAYSVEEKVRSHFKLETGSIPRAYALACFDQHGRSLSRWRSSSRYRAPRTPWSTACSSSRVVSGLFSYHRPGNVTGRLGCGRVRRPGRLCSQQLRAGQLRRNHITTLHSLAPANTTPLRQLCPREQTRNHSPCCKGLPYLPLTLVPTFTCCRSAAKEVSCWHEIPLYAGDGHLHYICEIPKETSAKMEVATVRTVWTRARRALEQGQTVKARARARN